MVVRLRFRGVDRYDPFLATIARFGLATVAMPPCCENLIVSHRALSVVSMFGRVWRCVCNDCPVRVTLMAALGRRASRGPTARVDRATRYSGASKNAIARASSAIETLRQSDQS